jgi:Retroviral aspartyl protease
VETVYSRTTRNYKFSATVGVTTVVQTPVRAILDTGAGYNLVREAVIPEDWQCRHLTGETECRIVGAGGRKLRQKGVLILHVQVGQLRLCCAKQTHVSRTELAQLHVHRLIT